MSSDYADFDLEILRVRRGRYQARVIESPAGQASVEFKRPFSETELGDFVLKIGQTRTGTRYIDSPEMQAAEAFGKKLFGKIFKEALRETLTSSLHQIDRGEIPGLRVRLRLVDVPELADLPWEYLYHPTLKRFIVLSTRTPIIRYTDLPRPVQPLSVTAPLRLLVMISAPTDYEELDVKQERFKIEDALHGLEQRGLISLEWLEEASLEALQRRLRKEPVHLFHFIGHGGWDADAQEGTLVFEDEEQLGQEVRASYLATILSDHAWLRLVILNSCEGARATSIDPFASVAGLLVQQGVPSVLAMQFEITDEAAIQLSQVFYEALADNLSAEAALAEARKAIYASGNDVEWGTPVLYLRAEDGHIFDLQAATAPETEDERKAREKAEAERKAAEKAEQEKAEAERKAAEKAEQEKAEAERKAAEKAEQGKREAVQMAARLALPAGQTGNKVVNSVAFSPDGMYLALGNGTSTGSSDAESVSKGEADRRERMSSSLGSRMAALGEARTSIRLLRLPDGKTVQTLPGHTRGVNSVVFSPDGSLLASGSDDMTVRLWRASNGMHLKTFVGHLGAVNSVAFSPDGTLLASGSYDMSVQLGLVETGTLMKASKGHTGGVNSVAFSPDGNLLASASDDKRVCLWRVPDHMGGSFFVSAFDEPLLALEGHTGWVLGVAFSPDGSILASCAYDGSVRLWRVADGTLLKTLEVDSGGVRSVAFSPRGALLASGGDDLRVRLWRVPEGELLTTIEGHTGRVSCVVFSADGRLLASASHDRSVRLHDVPANLNS